MAEVYFKSAAAAFDQGELKDSLEILNLSISFNKDSSDARYLKAKILFSTGKYRNSIKELKIALLTGNWHIYSEFDALILSAEYYLHSGDFKSAYDKLKPYKEKLGGNIEAARIFTKAAEKTGKIEEALEVAGLFPAADFSQSILVKYDRGWRSKALGKILSGDNAGFYTKSTVRILIESDSGDSAALLGYYKAKWGKDRFYLINSLILEDTDNMQTVNSIFSSSNTINRNELLRIRDILDNKEVSYDEKAFFKDKSILVNEDINKDGTVDGKTVLESGFIKEAEFDPDQDGILDFRIISSDGRIQSIDIKYPDRIVTAVYNPYPYLEKYIVRFEDRERVYFLLPYKLSYPAAVIPESQITGIISLNRYLKEPSPLYLEKVSEKIIEKNNENMETLTAERKSITDTVLKYSRSDGSVYRLREYNGAEVVKEKKDIDNDGLPEIYYEYENGELRSVSFDRNHNGYPEYRETYIPGNLSEWDFDDDGLFDYREYISGNRLVREYSTMMDGKFDLKMEDPVKHPEIGVLK